VAASEQQENNKQPLFAPEGQGKPIGPEAGMILLHKKSAHDNVMSYIVHDIYRHTEEPRPLMVAYKALYKTDGVYKNHVRPLEMFTSDRFITIGFVQDIKALMKS
jgi:hypothetical protein